MNHNDSTRTCDTGVVNNTSITDDSTAIPMDNYKPVQLNRHERRKLEAQKRRKKHGN